MVTQGLQSLIPEILQLRTTCRLKRTSEQGLFTYRLNFANAAATKNIKRLTPGAMLFQSHWSESCFLQQKVRWVAAVSMNTTDLCCRQYNHCRFVNSKPVFNNRSIQEIESLFAKRRFWYQSSRARQQRYLPLR